MLNGLLRAARAISPQELLELTRQAATPGSFRTPSPTTSTALISTTETPSSSTSKHTSTSHQQMPAPAMASITTNVSSPTTSPFQHHDLEHAQEEQVAPAPLFARVFLGHDRKHSSFFGRAIAASHAINVSEYLSDDEE